MELRAGKCLLPDRLRERGLTQQWLADKINRTRQQVSDYCTGRRTMSLNTACMVARAVGCTIEELYEWEQA